MSRKQQPGDDPPVVDAAPIFSLLASLARAADVKWLESGGARVVPIRFDSPPAATRVHFWGAGGGRVGERATAVVSTRAHEQARAHEQSAAV